MQYQMFKYGAAFVAAAFITAATSCNQSDNKGNKPAQTAVTTAPESQEAPTRIAYVQLDSVLNNYAQYKEMQTRLEKKGNDSRASLSAKMNSLQRAGADFQQKLQNNQFLTREAAEAEQAKLMKMEQDIQKLNASLTEQLVKEQQAAEEKLYNTIKERIAELNKEWGYDLILTNVKADNMLYGNPKMDITDKVIEGLNEHYTADESPEKITEAKKK